MITLNGDKFRRDIRKEWWFLLAMIVIGIAGATIRHEPYGLPIVLGAMTLGIFGRAAMLEWIVFGQPDD